MAVTPERTPGAFGHAPAGAPHEWAQPEDPTALAQRARLAQQNERQLEPLIVQPQKAPIVQKAATVAAPQQPRPIAPSQSRLRIPGQPKPSVHIPAETVARAKPAIVLTDAPGVPVDKREDGASVSGARDSASVPVQLGQGARPARPPVTADVAAHLDSPLAAAARKLHEQRALTHQPAASHTDSPSRGVPTPITDPGKVITGGFGDAGDAQYFPLNGSELRELVRGLMSVISEQIENDLRFSMAICYPRVAATVTVEVQAYAAGGDGGQYDPGFSIVKIMPPHTKTPIEIARERADSVCFVVIADRTEMTADGQSIAPPNQIREELGLVAPRKQAIQTPQGRLIVDLPA